MSAELVLSREFNGHLIGQRRIDGYVNVTEMFKYHGKQWFNYHKLERYNTLLNKIMIELSLSESQLVISVMTGLNEHRGTWVHPKIADDVEKYLSNTHKNIKHNRFIYFIFVPLVKRIKIGIANDPERRAATFESVMGMPNKIIGTMIGDLRTESRILEKFSRFHIANEWHRDVSEIRQFIADNCRQTAID